MACTTTICPFHPTPALPQLPNGHAARPNYSAAGTRIEVLTNHLPLDVNVGAVTQYEVQVRRRAAEGHKGGANEQRLPALPTFM